MDKENGRKRGMRSCKVATLLFRQVCSILRKTRLALCLPRAASDFPLAEAVLEGQVHPVWAEGFPGSWNIRVRKIGIIFDMR